MRNNYRHPDSTDTIVLNLVLNLVSVTHTKFSRVSFKALLYFWLQQNKLITCARPARGLLRHARGFQFL